MEYETKGPHWEKKPLTGFWTQPRKLSPSTAAAPMDLSVKQYGKLHRNEGDDVTLLVQLLASIQQKPKELKRCSLSSSALFASAFLRASGILWCRPGIHTAFPVTIRKYVLMALRQMSLLYIITHRFDTINASNPQFFFFQINKQ